MNDDGPRESIYHGVWKYQVRLFFEANLTIFSRTLLERPYRGHGRPAHECVLHVSSSAFSIPWLIGWNRVYVTTFRNGVTVFYTLVFLLPKRVFLPPKSFAASFG